MPSGVLQPGHVDYIAFETGVYLPLFTPRLWYAVVAIFSK
jgi:hypothetical protein